MPIERKKSSVYVASVINHWLSAVPGRRQRIALLSLVLSTDSYSLKIALHYLRKVRRFQAILLRHPLPRSSRTADTRINHRRGGGLWLLPFISGTWNNAIIYNRARYHIHVPMMVGWQRYVISRWSCNCYRESTGRRKCVARSRGSRRPSVYNNVGRSHSISSVGISGSSRQRASLILRKL